MKSQVEQVAARWDGTNVRRVAALTAGMKPPEVRELRQLVMQARRDIGYLIAQLEQKDDYERQVQSGQSWEDRCLLKEEAERRQWSES